MRSPQSPSASCAAWHRPEGARVRVGQTLSRYFGTRFLLATLAALGGVMALVALIDYVELVRRTADIPHATALMVFQTSIFRVPQVTERIMPFCVLIGAMSCYLSLSRRNELVVARAAGVSAWEFIAPAVIVALGIGILATTIYNPISAAMHERSKRLEGVIFGNAQFFGTYGVSGFWIRQKSVDGQSIINAASSQEQGVRLANLTIFTFDQSGAFKERIEAKSALLQPGAWRLSEARIFAPGILPQSKDTYLLNTNLTPEQVRESFATPETVPFWQLPSYIETAEHAGLAAAGYRLQYQKLLSRPFLLAAMVLLAAAFSLRFFRFGGVQKMVLGGILSGFLLYVFSKVTEDISKAELLHPFAAAWIPVVVGGLTGLMALLYLEDG
ncbi:MAG: LPS export ABC transporter permease LptG [Rhizobiales bacterium]|nr:LPS export ABC transporter permease LptG [Hyphomicrobiales bacterium]